MKKTIMGSFMFLAGMISTALLLSGAASLGWTINGKHSVLWNLSQYGLLPVLYTFVGIAALGLCIAIWGLLILNFVLCKLAIPSPAPAL